jgi:hypothetical protein
MPGPADTFSQIGQQQQGPFSAYLDPSQQPQQGPPPATGWERHPHAVAAADIALGFLQGVRRNRLQQAALEDQNTQVSINAFRDSSARLLASGELTPEGAQALGNYVDGVLKQHMQYELPQAPNEGIAGVLKKILITASGGPIKRREPINFDEAIGKRDKLLSGIDPNSPTGQPVINPTTGQPIVTTKRQVVDKAVANATAEINNWKQTHPTPTEDELRGLPGVQKAFQDVSQLAPDRLGTLEGTIGVRMGAAYPALGSPQAIQQGLAPLLNQANTWTPGASPTPPPPTAPAGIDGGAPAGKLAPPPPQGGFGQPMSQFQQGAAQPTAPPPVAPGVVAQPAAPPTPPVPAPAGGATPATPRNPDDFKGDMVYDPNPFWQKAYNGDGQHIGLAGASKIPNSGVSILEAPHPVIVQYGEGKDMKIGHTTAVSFTGPGVPPGFFDVNTGQRILGTVLPETSSQALGMQQKLLDQQQQFRIDQQRRAQDHSDVMQQRALAASSARQLTGINAAYVRQAIGIADADMRQGRSLGEARASGVAKLNESFDNQINTFKRTAVANAERAAGHPLTPAEVAAAEKSVQPDIDQVDKDRQSTIGAFNDAVDESAPLTAPTPRPPAAPGRGAPAQKTAPGEATPAPGRGSNKAPAPATAAGAPKVIVKSAADFAAGK